MKALGLFAVAGRFPDTGTGTFYATDSIDIALAEALHHRGRVIGVR